MPRRYEKKNVFDAAIDRMTELYEEGHRIVVSFSAGKDSGVCLEICLIAANLTGRLPVEVVMRDEEIMFPGTFEYAERVAARPDVSFHWLIANQPVVNVFNREMPYFWTFDPLLDPEQWVRRPPEYAQYIPEKYIQGICYPGRFPPPEGKDLFCVIGLRAAESIQRSLGVFSSKGHLTNKDSWGTRRVRPIYDWSDGDVWKAIADNKWDYNHAYDTMNRLGVPRQNLRIAPPTLTAAGAETLNMAMRAWPKWFDKVNKRLPGVRTVAMYGRRALEPIRRMGETWEACFRRTCIEDAPAWIADRARQVMERHLKEHARHSTEPFPQNTACAKCGMLNSWKMMANVMYMGDPFSMKYDRLPPVEPEFFRPGSGTWGGGKPTF
ncbi:hypothetical protein LLH00_06065 [bacterium]|nr:hypothetical protein [bacterium]